MATPTASSSIKNASTPQSQQHLNPFSTPMPPRSAPSPATARSQAGRSPHSATNHSTTHTPHLGHVKNSQAFGSSPAATSQSPAAMIPSLSGLGFLEGSFPMSVGMSRGTGTTITKITQEEKQKRLHQAISLMQQCPLRTSPESLEILGQRIGYACLLDPTAGPRKDGTRDCIFAGEISALDFKFKGNNVTSVSVSFPDPSDDMSKFLKSAGKILRENLLCKDAHSSDLQFDIFSKNVQRLSKLDKLNHTTLRPSFNCYEAIFGVHQSLRKLFEHEKSVILDTYSSKSPNEIAKAVREVISKKSGRPVINTDKHVGFQLEYWMPKQNVSKNMSNIYSLNIECESITSPNQLPIRVSKNWVSDHIMKKEVQTSDIFETLIDWQDPPPTYLPNESELSSQTQRPPNIRFVAKLDPPIDIPFTIYNQMLSIPVEQQDPNLIDGAYHLLTLLRGADDQESAKNDFTKSFSSTRYVSRLNKDRNTEPEISHNRFLNAKIVPAKTIDEIPFSHPKELVQILPVLRQWAQINFILREIFGPDARSTKSEPTLTQKEKLPTRLIDMQFDPITCRFVLTFPTFTTSEVNSENKIITAPKSANITFEVLSNGGIQMLAQTLVSSHHYGDIKPKVDPSNHDIEMQDAVTEVNELDIMTKSFDLCQDVNVWIPWLCEWANVINN